MSAGRSTPPDGRHVVLDSYALVWPVDEFPRVAVLIGDDVACAELVGKDLETGLSQALGVSLTRAGGVFLSAFRGGPTS